MCLILFGSTRGAISVFIFLRGVKGCRDPEAKSLSCDTVRCCLHRTAGSPVIVGLCMCELILLPGV